MLRGRRRLSRRDVGEAGNLGRLVPGQIKIVQTVRRLDGKAVLWTQAFFQIVMADQQQRLGFRVTFLRQQALAQGGFQVADGVGEVTSVHLATVSKSRTQKRLALAGLASASQAQTKLGATLV